MGERVVIGREPPLAQEAPPAAPPLDYGKGGRGEDFWRSFNATVQAVAELLARGWVAARPYVGAWWRQVVFAVGLGCVLAGLGHCLHRHSYGSEGVVLMFIGGVMIGLCVRVPLIGQPK